MKACARARQTARTRAVMGTRGPPTSAPAASRAAATGGGRSAPRPASGGMPPPRDRRPPARTHRRDASPSQPGRARGRRPAPRQGGGARATRPRSRAATRPRTPRAATLRHHAPAGRQETRHGQRQQGAGRAPRRRHHQPRARRQLGHAGKPARASAPGEALGTGEHPAETRASRPRIADQDAHRERGQRREATGNSRRQRRNGN